MALCKLILYFFSCDCNELVLEGFARNRTMRARIEVAFGSV